MVPSSSKVSPYIYLKPKGRTRGRYGQARQPVFGYFVSRGLLQLPVSLP